MGNQNSVDDMKSTVHTLDNTNYWFYTTEGAITTLACLVLLISFWRNPKRSKDKDFIIIVALMLLYGIFEIPLKGIFLLNMT